MLFLTYKYDQRFRIFFLYHENNMITYGPQMFKDASILGQFIEVCRYSVYEVCYLPPR